jgi:hypothetical protein
VQLERAVEKLRCSLAEYIPTQFVGSLWLWLLFLQLNHIEKLKPSFGKTSASFLLLLITFQRCAYFYERMYPWTVLALILKPPVISFITFFFVFFFFFFFFFFLQCTYKFFFLKQSCLRIGTSKNFTIVK